MAGHVSATLDEGTGGDVGGHMPFLLSSTHYYLHGSRQQGAAIRLSPTRDHYGAVNYLGLLVIIEQNPPTHLVATMPQLRDTRVTRLARARASTRSGTRMRGRACSSTSQLRQGIPTVFTVSDMRSAVLVNYPPSHGIRALPHLLHLWLCLAPRRCYSEGLPSTCGTGGM